jgi:hypothetical protein
MYEIPISVANPVSYEPCPYRFSSTGNAKVAEKPPSIKAKAKYKAKGMHKRAWLKSHATADKFCLGSFKPPSSSSTRSYLAFLIHRGSIIARKMHQETASG